MNDKLFPDEEKEKTITIKVGSNTREIIHYILIVLIGILFLQNSYSVNFNFFFWSFSVSLILLLPFLFLLGYLFSHFKVFLSIKNTNQKKV